MHTEVKLTTRRSIFQRIRAIRKRNRLLANLKRGDVNDKLFHVIKAAVRGKALSLVPMAFRPLGDCGPIVVARRGDGLGGRLGAMLNAWSVAKALGLEFRVVWPRVALQATSHPEQLFDAGFLARFECRKEDLEGRAVLRVPTHLSLEDAREWVRNARRDAIIDVSECFEILSFAGEAPNTAHARFKAAMSEIGWSGSALSMMESIAACRPAASYSAIHVRAGDIVSGDWRQFVPVDKYMPTFHVEYAIAALLDSGDEEVVIFSDNQDYAAFLKHKFVSVRTSDQCAPNYNAFNSQQRAFADIVILSRARSIVGPQSSAFSRLAANLRNVKIVSIGQLTTEQHALDLLRRGLTNSKEQRTSSVLRPLLARDICWFLDVFAEDVTLDERLALSGLAVELEPEFCGGLNHLSLSKAMSGDVGASQDVASRAYQAAERATCHSDPLVESLAASISSAVLSILCGSMVLSDLSMDDVVNLRRKCLEQVPRLEGDFEKCEALVPFQIHHKDLLLNLRFQLSALKGLAHAHPDVIRRARRSLQDHMHDMSFMATWRPSGFSRLSGAGSYPQVVRNIEVVTIRIVRALAAALSHNPGRAPGDIHFDATFTTASGMRWIQGHAMGGNDGPGQAAIGYVTDGTWRSGGPAFPRHASRRGFTGPRSGPEFAFAFPIPLDSPREASSIMPDIQFAGSG